jgi:hypothetical protein
MRIGSTLSCRRAFASLAGLAALLALPASLGACQHDVATSFPPGLAPLEPDSAPPPDPAAGDAHPETINAIPGTDDTSNFVHATGYVHASVADVWAAMQDPGVVVDRHNVDSYTVDWNVEPGYDVSFQTTYTVHHVVTVSFAITWREGLVEGTKDAPTAVSVVYEKTFGSSYINLMKGSIELTAVDATTTKLEFAQRMDATQTDQTTILVWTTGMFQSIVARVHGQPLP